MAFQAIPRVKEAFWVGSALDMARDAPGFLVHIAHTYGPIVEFVAFGQRLILITRPDLLHEVLVEKADRFPKARRDVSILAKVLGTGLLTNNGASHRQRRRLMQPAFHQKRIQAYAGTMLDYTQEMLANWQDGETRDISQEMMQLTMFIVTKSLFGVDRAAMNDLVEEITEAVDYIQSSLRFDYSYREVVPGWVPTASRRGADAGRHTLDEVVNRIVAQHRHRSPEELAARIDLLSLLLLAEDEDGNRLDEAALRDEVVTLFLAGHETTSNALTWTLSLLAQHPEVEARLHAEVDDVLAQEPLRLDTLPRLPYTLAVIKEAMRLYPPAWALNGRQCETATPVGEYLIPKDAILLLSPYVQHRLPEYFPDPETFDPLRFTPEREKALPKHVYMPFGAGPRICIGNSFAMLEAHLILAAIAHRFRLALPPGFQPTLLAQITLVPKGGMPMRIAARRPPADQPAVRHKAAVAA